MIPQTAGALLAFLALIAPGAIFELSRERQLPGAQRTAFREATTVALSSLAFTVLALTLLAAIRLPFPFLVADPGRWFLQGSRYVAENFYLASSSLVLIVVIACFLAWVTSKVFKRERSGVRRADLEPVSLWFLAIRRDRRENSNPWVHVGLVNGDSFFGYVKNYSAHLEVSAREIQLSGPGLCYRPAATDTRPRPQDKDLNSWDSVILERKDILFLKVQHKVD